MGNNFCGPYNIDNNNKEKTDEEKKLGKSIINNLLGKLELFERKEILININNPSKNINISKRILNSEIIDDIIHDYYPKYSKNLIVTLNGYIISKELSLKDNLVRENDYIFISEPLEIYFVLSNEKEFLIKVSEYQIFLDVFQKFCENTCSKEYKSILSEAYYNDKFIQPFEQISNLGIKENEKIFIILGRDNNTKSIYNQGLEKLNRINYIYFDEKNKISINDYKLEFNKQNLDNIELMNIGMINFRNLKILILIECNIQNMDFLNSYSFWNLEEINLQKNKISYFTELILYKLKKLDLSNNNLRKNMINPEINDTINNDFSIKLNKPFSIILPKLKILNLSFNKIENINILSQIQAEELKELNLSYNEIKNIDALNSVYFGYLKKINLSNNKIEELTTLKNLSFCNNIEEINLMNNEIVNLNVLREVSLPNLKILNILNNDINDYSTLRLIYFPKLEILYAFPNQLNPNKYDIDSEIFVNFQNSCKHIIEKNVEVRYKI